MLELGPHARLALDALTMKPTRGIPSWLLNVMDMGFLEEFSGHPAGSYLADHGTVYLDFQRALGACFIDQYIPENPATMRDEGFESQTHRTATTGLEEIVQDGIRIDSPEAVVEHLERCEFPRLESAIANLDPDDPEEVRWRVQGERDVQRTFGPGILKVPYGYGFQMFPGFRYFQYGYQNYFMAYALYPEVLEKDFRLQADFAVNHNQVAARAIVEGALPPVVRLDHDMCDSRGPLVSVESLERLWLPHFQRALQPHLDAGIRLIWHSDGNVMPMVPLLLESGIGGFQGFQYEDGVDYPALCRMTDRNGHPLQIWAGVSVTTTLPHGTPQDVRDELKRLVEYGPKVGLVLGASSSITPGTNRENIRALIEGMRYYRECGRD